MDRLDSFCAPTASATTIVLAMGTAAAGEELDLQAAMPAHNVPADAPMTVSWRGLTGVAKSSDTTAACGPETWGTG